MWLALISFLLPVVHYSTAQYVNIAQFGQQQAVGAPAYARTQYQFWRPQFDHTAQYQQGPQPQYQASQPAYQNQGSAGYTETAPAQYQQQQQPQQYQPQQAPPQYQQQAPQYQQVAQPQTYQQPAQPQPQQYQQPSQPQAPYQQPAEPQIYQPQQPQPQQQQGYQQRPQQYQQPQQQVYREQPQMYQQQVKQVYQPQIQQQQFYPQQQVNAAPNPPPVPQVQPNFAAQAPPPPDRFVPYVSDVYHPEKNISPARYSRPQVITILTQNENIPEGTYVAEEIIVDGNHPSYVENVERHSSPLRISKKFINSPQQQQQRVIPQPDARLKAPVINNAVNVPSVSTTGQRQPPPPPQPQPQQPQQPRIQPHQSSVHQSRPQSSSSISQNQVRRPNVESPHATVSTGAGSSMSANARSSAVFLTCCKARKVAKSCERICDFDVLSKKTLTGMFLGTDPCPQSYGLDLLQCAAQNEDHTDCCRSKDVHRTSAGEKCLGFCNMRPGITFQADVSMLPCWAVLNDIKSCFKEHIEEGIQQG